LNAFVAQIASGLKEPGLSGSIHSISTSIGPVRAHRFFVYALKSIYEQLDT
jgi:hypothetical protein